MRAGERLLVQRPRREEVALLAERLVALQQLFLRHRYHPPFKLEPLPHTPVGSSPRRTADQPSSAPVATPAPARHFALPALDDQLTLAPRRPSRAHAIGPRAR